MYPARPLLRTATRWRSITHLLGLVRLQVLLLELPDVQILEGFSEAGVDSVVQLGQFQELGIDG